MSSAPPDWSLIKEITRVVHSAPGGGIHRAELAERFLLPAYGPAIRAALGIAYRHRKIDFCGEYVVRRPELNSARTAGTATETRKAA